MLSYSRPFIEKDDLAAVSKVLRSTHLTQGPATAAYERALEKYLGVEHVVSLSSGTAALHLAVLAEEPDKNTYGFVPPITFSATLNAFWYCGVKNVLPIDVDSLTGLVTPVTLEASLKKAPASAKKIAIPVSLQGRPLDYVRLAAVAKKYHCTLIEDAAQALGGFYASGRGIYKCGSCAHTVSATASTHAVKQLCTGEGGFYATNDPARAARVRLLRSHGIVADPAHPGHYAHQIALGYNFRLTEIQAALGLSQLKKLDCRLALRERLASAYDAALSAPFFRPHLQIVPRPTGHALHLYVVLLRDEATRDAAIEFFQAHGVVVRAHHTPLNRMPYHAAHLRRLPTPGAEAYYARCLSLPLFPQLTLAELERQVRLLHQFFQKHPDE